MALITTGEIADRLGEAIGSAVLVTEHQRERAPEHNPTDADRPTPAGRRPRRLHHLHLRIDRRPKGVTVLHRALVNLWCYHTAVTFRSPEAEAAGGRVALSASLSFDTSWEGVLAMIAGHEPAPARREPRRDPSGDGRLPDTPQDQSD